MTWDLWLEGEWAGDVSGTLDEAFAEARLASAERGCDCEVTCSPDSAGVVARVSPGPAVH